MRNPLSHLALVAALLAAPATLPAAAQQPTATPAASGADAAATRATAIADALLDQLDAGDYAAAGATFTEEMSAAVPLDQLQAAWESLPRQLGAATGRGQARVVAQNGLHVVVRQLDYQRGAVIAQTAVDAQGRIAGFLLQPAAPAPASATPAAD